MRTCDASPLGSRTLRRSAANEIVIIQREVTRPRRAPSSCRGLLLPYSSGPVSSMTVVIDRRSAM